MLIFLFRRKTLTLLSAFLFAALGLFFSACSGGECAANFTVLEDFDSDCVEDTNDNCVLEENAAGSYNPEQFDGDDDGVGVPCDGDDTNDQSTGVFLTSNETFNLGGDYEFSGGCTDVSFLSASQDGDFIAATDGASVEYLGYAALGESGELTAVIWGDSRSCSLSVLPTDDTARLSCLDATSAEPCVATGRKTLTRLWADLPRPAPDDASLAGLLAFCADEAAPDEACAALYERRQE